MIVKCEQCQTRFKIPDERVTDKGVKVRCTKCQHTFRVTREGQNAATAQQPAYAPPVAGPPQADPFAAFGQAANVSHEEATRPGMMRPSMSPPAPVPHNPFEEDAPTRVGPMPTNLGMMRPSKGPLGLTAPHPPGPGGPQPGNNPFAFALGSAPLPPTREVPAMSGGEFTQPATPAWSGADPFSAPPAAADPFASFGSSAPAPNAVTATVPAMRAAPLQTNQVDASAWTQPQAAYPPPRGPGRDGAATYTGPMPATQKNPAFVPQAAPPAKPGVWDFASTPQPASAAVSPFDFSGAPARDDSAPAAWNTPAPAGPDPFAAAAIPDPYSAPEPQGVSFAPPGGSMPQAAGPFNDASFNQSSFGAPLEPPPSAPTQQEPVPELPPFSDQGFGDSAVPQSEDVSSTFTASEPGDASSLFGAPGSALSPDVGPLPPMASDRASQPLARLDLARKSVDELAADLALEKAAAAAAREAAPPVEFAPEVMPPSRGSTAGIIANISVAAVLLLVLLGLGTAYFNEGKVDVSALTLSRFKEYFATSRAFVTVDLSNGLYETRGGHPLFFVRGEVINRSGKETRVVVKAEIFDGDQLVRSAQGWAGTLPSVEELNAVSAADDVERLNEKLSAQAKPIAAGANGNFLVPFYEYPADLKGIRVKVVVSDAESPKAAAR